MNLSNIKLTIIICTYNRSQSLSNTVNSIIESVSENADFVKIIIVNNNSSDDTRLICDELMIHCPIEVTYIEETRQGKTYALNAGILQSTGDVIAFIDDDVCVDKKWFSYVFKTFIEYPECDVFGGRILPLLHEGSILPEWVRQEEPHYNAEGPLGDHNKGDQVKSYYETDMGTPCGANFFVRRSVFERYGLFNENLNKVVKDLPMAEDSEFCFRLKKNNVQMLYIPEAVVYHDTPPEKLTKKYFRRYICRMSRAYVHAAKVELGTKRILNIPRYVLRMVAERFICYLRSIATGEDVGLKFSKQLELLQILAICYWYFSDRRMLKND